MIIFENVGEIDLRSISTFGVSVKEGDNPIGFFGTGLKYAIAVLLRTGHQIVIQAGRQVVNFAIDRQPVRGQDFEFVTMQVDAGAPAPIGFTTELGKQWELWMAFRELACNCKDEAGQSSRAGDLPTPEEGVTRICVIGDAFDAVFADAHRYILSDEPDFATAEIEVRRRPSQDVFYRGVRVMRLDRPARFTYNVLTKLDLTEDRTVKYPFYVNSRIAALVLTSQDDEFVRDMVTSDEETFEGRLDLHGWSTPASEVFKKSVTAAVRDARNKVNPTALRVVMDLRREFVEPEEVPLTDVQFQSFNKALDFCARIGFHIRGAYPVKFVETLGDNILGRAENGTIYVAERVFHLGGTKQLASTLIEEYLHLRHGWEDCTRALQNFLFDKLVSMGEELAGEPL